MSYHPSTSRSAPRSSFHPSLVLPVVLMAAVLAGCVTHPQPGERLERLFDATGGAMTVERDDRPLSPYAQAMYHVLAGEVAAERGQRAEAAQAYLQAAQLSGQPEVAREAARHALASNDKALSVAASKAWLAAAPDDVQAQEAAFRVAVRAENYDDALVVARQWVASHADGRGPALRAVAGVLVRDDVPAADAYRVMQPLVEAQVDSPHAHYAMGLVAMNAQDWSRAQQAAQRAQALRAGWVDAQLLEAGVLVKQGRVLEGIAAVEPSLRDGSKPDKRFALARLLIEARSLDLAGEQLRQVIAEDAKHAEARYALGLLALERDNLDAAEQQFLELVEMPGQRFDAAYYLGRIAEARGELDAARGWYRRVGGGRHQADALTRRAYLMAEDGHIDEAKTYLRGLARLNPSMEPRLLAVEADVLQQAGKFEEAVATYDRALDAAPDDLDLLYGRSLAYEQAGNIAAAKADLRRMLELDSDNPQALNALGYILTNHSTNYGRARELIARALALQPEDPAIIDSMGWVEYRLGNLDSAVTYLQRAFDKLPDPEVAAHLGEVLWQLGRRDEARAVWDAALARHPDHGTLQETVSRLTQ